ncbi:MAG TPA: nucleoside-diphosphate sugar epimerase/dehydratase [Pyrinomonadaceae bacterium]|nr:nucleoside-diphosphate sugar epimerase/dehydratase [Pyrinomonadaceae bacterium]
MTNPPDKHKKNERYRFLLRPFQLLADVAILSGAFFLAYLFRFDFEIPKYYLDNALDQIPFVVLVQFASLFGVGAYSIIWRYVSLEDVKAFVKAAVVSGVVLVLFRLLLSPDRFIRWQVPLSIILMDTFFAFAGLLSLRVLRRFFYEFSEKRTFQLGKRRKVPKSTLIVGAGRLGAATIKEVGGRADTELNVKGFIDDDRYKKGGSVGGKKVLGTTEDLARLASELNIDQIVLAIDGAKSKEIRRVLDICRAIPVKAQIVPSLNEIAHGRVAINHIRDVQIEDLLGREPVELDDKNLHDFLTGKTVMVTGAGGSIGSELVKQIADFNPKLLVLVERTEFALFEIERELAKNFPETKFIPLLADVGDAPRMREIFGGYMPQVVFHAAAHKHVPLMEINPTEAIKNNIFATKLIGELAGEFGAKDFVLISTDKAVNPTSVMGASKRIAEIVLQNLDSVYQTNYMAVRFGNVLGSTGSVIPIFREQIKNGKSITVTDPKMTRYFMTIPEASQLVLQAGAIGEGGEIFILDMGEPVKILELAEDMIRLSGLEPYEDIDIVFTGVRQGEKLFEELEITGENLLKTRHPKIFVGKIGTYEQTEVDNILSNFRQAVDENDRAKIRSLLNHFLPEAKISDEKENSFTGKMTETKKLTAAQGSSALENRLQKS